jgi:hypothetical protein
MFVFDFNKKNRDNYAVLCACSMEDLSGLKHVAVEQFIELYKTSPCLCRVGNKEHFNKETKRL